MTRSVKLSHRLEYLAFQAVVQTVANLPLGAACSVAASVARGVGMRTSLRRRAERNLTYAMPDLDTEARSVILAEMFDGLTRTAFEYRYLPKIMRETDRLNLVGAEHIEMARKAGKGAVLATGHFGNWEMIRTALAVHNWPPALIYRAFNNPLFDDFAMQLMTAVEAPIFHKGRRGSLGMVRHVKAGGAVVILTDQRFSGAPNIPFFGHPAQTSLGAAEVALNYGAALLPVRAERIGRDSRFRIIVEPPVVTEGRTAHALTAELNARLESWIRAAPSQYFWMHNRWGKAALRTASTNDDQ